MSAFLAGFATGFVDESRRIDERKSEEKRRKEELDLRKAERDEARRERLEMFLLGKREDFRGDLLKVAAARRQSSAELESQIKKGVSIGLSGKSTMALQQSGQLDLFLEKYDQNQKTDPAFIASLDAFILGKIESDEGISKALMAGVSTDRDVSDPRQSSMAMVESILSATSQEELDKLAIKLYTPETTTSLPRFEVDFTTMAGPSDEETRGIRKELAETLGTYFKDSFTVTSDGQVVVSQSAEPEVRTLFNELERTAREQSFGPTRTMSASDAASRAARSVQQAKTTNPNLTAGDMLQGLPSLFEDPVGFAEHFKVAPPKAPDYDPASVVESMGNSWDPNIEWQNYGR
jgi:hypothetical protein